MWIVESRCLFAMVIREFNTKKEASAYVKTIGYAYAPKVYECLEDSPLSIEIEVVTPNDYELIQTIFRSPKEIRQHNGRAVISYNGMHKVIHGTGTGQFIFG